MTALEKILKIALFCIFCSFTGCKFPADAAVRVKGKVVDHGGEPINSCELLVYNKNSVLLDKKDISSNFVTTIILDPSLKELSFKVLCKDIQGEFLSEIYSLKGIESYRNPIDLGVINMQE